MNLLHEIKEMIETHFSTFLINLADMGANLPEKDVRDLLNEELKTVQTFLDDAVRELLELKYGKPKANIQKWFVIDINLMTSLYVWITKIELNFF